MCHLEELLNYEIKILKSTSRLKHKYMHKVGGDIHHVSVPGI